MKVLVTGGTGFLGKRLVRNLLARGHDVRCLVRPGSGGESFRAAVTPDSASAGNLEIVHGTLNRIEAAVDAMRGCDSMVHAAAAMGGGAPALFTNNVVAMRQLVAIVPQLGVGRFVHISSLGVYGPQNLKAGDVLDETTPVDPRPHLRDAYSYSKIAQEEIAWEAHREGKLPLVVVRPGVIYGPDRGCLSGRIGLQFGNVMVRMGGGQRVPYTYVDNCADAIALAATVPGVESEVFNILDDDPPSARYVLRQYRKQVRRLRVVPVPHWAISPLSGAVEWYHKKSGGQLPAVLTRYKSAAYWKRLKYSNAKAKSRLGWTPKVSFVEGIRLSCEWDRKHLAAGKEAAA